MESADHVFPGSRVHAGLSADGTIDHGKKCRWDLDMWNAALKNCRRKSGEIADHSAAKSNDKRLSIQARIDHFFADRAHLLERFRFLTCRGRNQRRLELGG